MGAIGGWDWCLASSRRWIWGQICYHSLLLCCEDSHNSCYYRISNCGNAAEQFAQEVGIGRGVDIVCPMVRNFKHGLRRVKVRSCKRWIRPNTCVVFGNIEWCFLHINKEREKQKDSKTNPPPSISALTNIMDGQCYMVEKINGQCYIAHHMECIDIQQLLAGISVVGRRQKAKRVVFRFGVMLCVLYEFMCCARVGLRALGCLVSVFQMLILAQSDPIVCATNQPYWEQRHQIHFLRQRLMKNIYDDNK